MSSDEAALDMLSYLWGNTRNSPLYQRFVDKEWAIQVGANNNPLSAINHELAGEFSFIVVGYPWSDINGLRSMLATAIDSFEFVNFSDEDLERAKINMLSNLSNGLEGASTKANYLSMFWYLDARGADGKLTNLESEAERIKSVTREDIMRVYRQYIKTKKSSTVVIEPARAGADGEKPKYQSFNPNADYRNPVAEAEYKGLQYRPVQDNFDRSVRPEPSAVKEVAVPQVQKIVLKNGLEVWTSPFDETPRVFVRMSIDGGALLEDGKTIPAGTADMLSMALQNGTAKRTPAELEQEMERLGASINIGAGATSMYVTLGCEKQNLEAAAALMREMLFEPRWDSDEYSKEKKRAVESANSDLLNRGTGASNAWSRLTQGDNALGTYVGASQYEKVQLSHCQAYWEKYFSPSVSKLVVVGSVNQEEVLQYFSFLGDWKAKTVNIPMPENNYEFQTSQIFGVEYVDAKQSDIYIGFKTLPYDATGDFYKATVMNFALAGNFNSRLNLKIREEKAWTYGIRGGFSAGYKDLPGTYVISAGVKSEATDSAIVEILNVLETYKNEGITDEEFAFTKSALIASEALDYESLFQKAGFILSMANRGLSEDYTAQQLATLQSMTKEEFNALAKQYLNTDELIVVVAGDMLRLEEKLNNLGFGTVQRLNKDGSGKIKMLKAGTTGHKKNYN
jgi:zinc protease